MAAQIPAKGKLLIAEPFMGDPNFERSVVLLCEHNEQGSFGLVLNQTSEPTLKDVVDGDFYADVPLGVGGPVEQNTLHFIHRLGGMIEESTRITEGLYWSGDFDQVKTLLNLGKITPADIRFFIGYSGWGGGQLAAELAQNAWIVSQADPDFIFGTPPGQLWRGILRRMEGKYRALANYPTDPRLN